MRILSGVFADERHRRPGHHRHADLDDDRERRPAQPRLFRDRHRLPARPRRLQPTSPSTACATIAAAAGSRRARPPRASPPARSPARSCAGVTIRGARGADRPARRRTATASTSAETEDNPFWCPDPDMVPVWEEHLETIRKAGSSTGAIVAVEATGVPAGWGAPIYGKLDAELAARPDVDQRRQGGGDRRGLRRRGADRRGERRRDARRATTGPLFLSNQRRRHPGRHLHRPAGDRAGGLQAHLLDPHARAARSTRPARRSSCAPRAATTPASASAPRRWSRPWSPACWPTPSCATAARPARLTRSDAAGRPAVG